MSEMACIDPEKIIPISRLSTEVFKTGTWSARQPCHREKVSPCRAACPAGNPIPRALLMASRGDLDGALGAFLEENPLPGVCGRVCYHCCESHCNRQQWDGAVHIQALERAASAHGNARPVALTEDGRGSPVAVVGSGPAGLSAAYHLARMGHRVTLIEEAPEIGGLLRWGIPEFRLPRKALQRDLDRILSLGIRVQTGVRVDGEALRELQSENQAVFLGLGARRSLALDVPGINPERVLLGLDFLREVRQGVRRSLFGKAVVIGGGNVAVDAALTALRLGAERVDLVCLEQPDEMPAHEMACQDARDEGILFHNGWGLGRISGGAGPVGGIAFVKCTAVFGREGTFHPSFDETVTLKLGADWVIQAVGQQPDLSLFHGTELAGGSAQDSLPVDPSTLSTAIEGVFGGGDLVTGPQSVVEAIAAGKRAALAIHLHCMGGDFSKWEEKTRLGGASAFSIHALFHPRDDWDPGSLVEFEDLEPMFLSVRPREEISRLAPHLRQAFREIVPSLDLQRVKAVVERCFYCGTCTGCDRCYLYCPEISILLPEGDRSEYLVHSEYCKGCAVCAAVCPRGVITMVEKK